jgi:hypothetical protein
MRFLLYIRLSTTCVRAIWDRGMPFENRSAAVYGPYMSAVTSVFGMLPLVLTPGAGSEFYRGLGSVVVGGLLISTVFTIFLVPALLSLVLDAFAALREPSKRIET